jgi:quercetin dioxygenase-like cupin family protein
MAHATAQDLKDLTPLLENLRTITSLKEKSLGCFYFKSKGILHFHTKDGRRYAHVCDGQRWHEVDLPAKISLAGQKKAFSAVQKLLPCKE